MDIKEGGGGESEIEGGVDLLRRVIGVWLKGKIRS